MNWRSPAQIAAAFVVAALAVWFSPDLLALVGLGEFIFVGQLCITILVLSALDMAFARVDQAIGPADHPPPDR